MSERNVQLMRGAYEAYNARDIEAFVAYFDPSIEFHSTFSVVGAVYHGRDGMRAYLRDLTDAWDEILVDPEAYFDLGEHTLIFILFHGRGRHSGAEVAMPIAQVARWREDLMVSLTSYVDRDDALRDLGLSDYELKPIAP